MSAVSWGHSNILQTLTFQELGYKIELQKIKLWSQQIMVLSDISAILSSTFKERKFPDS